ncbi:MAG: hypothetical protein NW241_03720 [Bacteroidia bacterium]|nr:hypothetical protein [Bacteroidia bacterium]
MQQLPSTFRLRIWAFLLLLAGTSVRAAAQCAMCKSSAMGEDASGNLAAESINAGILYLLAFPLIVAALIGGAVLYFRWKSRNQQAAVKGAA